MAKKYFVDGWLIITADHRLLTTAELTEITYYTLTPLFKTFTMFNVSKITKLQQIMELTVKQCHSPSSPVKTTVFE